MFTPSAGGGHARYSRELLTALARAGRGRYEFELITSEDVEPQFRSADAYRVNAVLPALRERSAYRSRAAWALSRVTHYVRRELRLLNWLKSRPDVDAVHFQEWTPWLAAPVFRRVRGMGKKVFYTVHNVVPHKYPALVPKSVMHGWMRKARKLADGLFVHTEQLAGEVVEFLREDRAKLPPITVSPHGVWSIDDAETLPPLSRRLRERKLLFFGRIRRNKGLDLLLRAARQLSGGGYTITIAGEPADRDYFATEIVPLIEQARAAGVRIELLDRFIGDDEVGPLFRSHGALVLPYTQEFVAQSGVLFMALAYELPVIASEVGGLRDVFEDYRIGTTFSQYTPEALASAVNELHAGESVPSLLRDMRAARERFSWDAAARATLGGYAAAMGEVNERVNDCRVETTAAA